MGWVDLVPGAGNLYIGGFGALHQSSLIRKAGITHVLSVIGPSLDMDADLLKPFIQLHISVEDDPNENLLQYFRQCNIFIENGLKCGGVFVHCAMGKSRSAAVIIAYLMSKSGASLSEASEQLCEGRPVCGPNRGFMEQLAVYYRMLNAENGEVGHKARSIYDGWAMNRFTGTAWDWERREKL